MAVTLKRKRGAVSYKEPSSDEDLSSSDSVTVPRKKSAVPVRRSTRYQSTEAEPSSSRLQRRESSPVQIRVHDDRRDLRRRPKRNISYRESSDADSDGDFEVEETFEPRRPRATAVQLPQPRKKLVTNRKLGRPSGAMSRKPFGAPLKPRTTPCLTSNPLRIPTDGRKPVWVSLPYHVLLQIFVYASHPLHDENMLSTSSISWLAQVARMCSTFTKPALTALYRNPPIFATKQNRKDLVQLLTSPPPNAHEEYRVMVKRLELDATQMASSTDPTHSPADLAALVAALSTVREIDIFDPLDRPPYRERLRRARRWHYPDELFSALRQSGLRLQSWRWNSSFFARELLWMKEIHTDKSFQSLRELTLTKFHPTESRKGDDEEQTTPMAEELLGSALATLPNLRSLAFESCKAVNGRLLPLLPTSLVSLSISNCFFLTAEALQAFLMDHGKRLEELVLNHNQCLDLSFLVDLKRSCPRLEVLRMDLNYYSSLVMSSDNEPLYDWLLGLDEVPTWPSTLRVIDMEYLRNWSSVAATNFFSSLIESAKELPWLRELRILAMVDVDWRQRADFRRKWAARFERVFLRKFTAPNAHLMSLRAFREWETAQSETADKNDSLLNVVEELPNNETAEGGSDAPIFPTHKRKQDDRWNPQRLRSRAKASAKYDETSDSRSGSDEPSDAEEQPEYVQGRCHTVIFRIDNLRPREELYDEGDFLDTERSGDEEWDGNDADDDGYAW